MIPTGGLLTTLLLATVVIIGASVVPGLVWLAVMYFGVLLTLVIVDVVISTKPEQVVVTRTHDSKLSLGVPNLIVVTITNNSPRPLRLAMRDEYPDPFISAHVIATGQFAPFSSNDIRYHVRPLTRGDYHFGATNLRYRSTLGTFQRQVGYPTEGAVRVYPNVLDVRKYDLMARKGLLTELGLRNAHVFGSGTEFERLRDYTTDDEFRRINWKGTARRNKLIAVEYETERSQHIMCVLDTGRLMRPPIGDLAKLDYAVNTALLTSYVATLRGDQVGMLTFADDVGVYLAPSKGRGQFYAMLELLYNLETEPVEADYGRALSYLGVKNKRRSLIILFTDLQTLDAAQPIIAYMGRLARQHVALLVTMSDPNVTRLADQALDTSQAVYSRAIAEQLLDERKVILDTLNRAGVLTLDVQADQLSIAVINRYLELKTRGRL
ncbi:MAG: DUF58 domain-containing protein [Herpetosiphonaceae bacterium]|nr:DUF58 domain-containing protein [Herpetosiphonaceae bacterium]